MMRSFLVSRCSPPRFLACGLFLAMCLGGLPVVLRAQAPAAGSAEDLSKQGNANFDGQNYKGAAALYEQLLKNFPNSEFAIDARFRLAYADYLTGQSDPAIDLLRKLIATPAAPADLLEQAFLLLPQALAQQAAALKPDDPKRKTGFEAAVKEYDTYAQKYPKAPGLETALYGRAVAHYQLSHFDLAARDLRQSLASFPSGASFLDTEFLLSLTVATQANLALAKENRSPAEAAAAYKGYEEAEKLLADIIRKRTDISLANDAQFQLGETLFAHAAGSPEPTQTRLFNQALAAYRAVEPKEPMIAAQDAYLRRVTDELVAENRKAAAANPARVRQLRELQAREASKLATLRAKDDTILTARIEAGKVFYSLKRYDETRVLMNALLASAKKPEDEKQVLFFQAMTYVVQNRADKAVAAYDKFQAKYAGDPIAERLPLLVAQLFQSGDKPDPSKAKKYLEDFSRLYPNSGLREMYTLQQAEASATQGQYDDGIKILDAFLKTQPAPKRELVVLAELSRARMFKDKKDYDGALTAYKHVRDTYKDRPEGDEAGFWVGWLAFQKNDAPGAINEIKTFQTQFPASRLMPNALMLLSQAQLKTNAKDQAIATLADVAKRFEKTPEGEGSYFQRANIYIGDKKFDDMVKVLTEFVDKYPDSDQAYSAYERIASVQVQNKQVDAAAATYEGFLTKQPSSDNAPGALGKLAGLWVQAARGMGAFISLGAPQQEAWKADVNKSIAVSERQLDKYPEAPATALGLQNLLECQRMLMDARVKKPEEVVQYFQALADKYKDKPAARSRILFRLASLTAVKDPAKALADMKAAYDPSVVYSPADVDQYGGGLLTSDPAAAAEVFDKLAKDYPLPAGVLPAQAPPDVQEAQALALYGRAKLADAKGDKATAAQLFGELKKNYPRSPKVPEANLGLAESLIDGKKYDEAMALLSEVARAAAAPLQAKARALFLNGVVQDAKGQVGAMDSYLKVAAFYPTAKDAAEGLWKGGQLLEKQAPTLTDTPAKPGDPTRSGQMARARKAYQDLTTKYPDAEWTAQAKARLAALPATAPAK